ncbi:glutathione S-transferase family protein [Phyllobacterium sp. 0TCS1.6C]|uniref:glutathione S-transferase family protein n=1 Tax=unclassified Phyllobacterium TaxID=2638441 RepID=UPI0022642F15|nr:MULTISPECIES: glutathione S-transferase family protein [unclassified Phyllobacterium]MCX8282352.1 glutathione S-transferase family protein [Phyllobacterium sp. 0TCS1.6C]MCX8292022.1 glutathione S-transferase family protein [Phyllobacterium sp. 0TCS1.6A]
MGVLVDGVWHDQWYDTKSSGGRFIRSQSQFRNWITADGSPGPNGSGGFEPEPGRYHLYVSYACPWAHRTLIFRALKGLEEQVSFSVVDHFMGADGWTFRIRDGATGDHLFGYDYLHQVYTRADAGYSGRVTVPVLWDKKRDTIVSNESAEIIRMFNSAFGDNGSPDFYPAELRSQIDEINAIIYPNINNGVYRAGFATTQEAYEEAFTQLFSTLDEVEARLSGQRYLVGDRLTEADWRLFTTLLRFDPVYVGHFKCNRQRIADYPNLSNYLRDLHQVEGVAPTVNMLHIKAHYYGSHRTINPTGIIPLGPDIDNGAPHDRGRFAARS